jgi:purine/pyrimidine-nucleoside phosphorylase
MAPVLEQLEKVTLKLKANVYFDGGVVSHGFAMPDGSRKSVGVIRPGKYHFTTDSPERMEIIAGECAVQQTGAKDWTSYKAGSFFEVPKKSAFDIRVEKGLAEYLCSYL